ncbi:MAG TPA: Flp family type IVb pilin [Syntrophaceticus sp.]|jgi:pilus assembly protein Flp/PilA|nr:Flp family type IVb pilin [Syntrophaceticus sp.]
MRREAKKLLKLAKRFFCEEEGQGMAEYGLILALIAVVVIGVLTAMGGGLKDIFNEVKEKLVVPAG